MTTTSQRRGLRRGRRLAAVLAAERQARAGVAAVDDDALDRRELRAQRVDVRRRLAPAADHAERGRPAAGEVLGRDRGCGRGPQLPERVGLEHRDDLRLVDRQQDDEERRAAGRPRKCLQTRQPEPAVDARHDRELPVGDRQAHARRVVDLAAGEPLKRLLDRFEPPPRASAGARRRPL